MPINNYYQPNLHSFGRYMGWVLWVFTIICRKIQEQTFHVLYPIWQQLKTSAWPSFVSSRSNLFHIYKSKGINSGIFYNVAPPMIDSLRFLSLVWCSICGMLKDLLFMIWIIVLGLDCLVWEIKQKLWRCCFDCKQNNKFCAYLWEKTCRNESFFVLTWNYE